MRATRFSVHPFAAAGIFLLLFAVPRSQSFAVITLPSCMNSGMGRRRFFSEKGLKK